MLTALHPKAPAAAAHASAARSMPEAPASLPPAPAVPGSAALLPPPPATAAAPTTTNDNHHHPEHNHNHNQDQHQTPTHENTVIKSRWKLSTILGKGAFGEVYLALDLITHHHVAIKVESPACKKPVLKLEISILQRLQESPYICRFIACGRFLSPKITSQQQQQRVQQQLVLLNRDSGTVAREPTYSYLVMELLGSNLSDVRKRMGGKFSVATTALLAKQMLHAIEAVHAIGILHRDIKPGNFCLAAQGSIHVDEFGRERCFLIDFGLARRYLSTSGRVREPRSKVGFRGTARYASIAAHQGVELSRADDLWSFFYIIVEFLKGTLPWKGKEKDRIGEMKQTYTNLSLVQGLPMPVHALYSYLMTLTYAAAPDYQLISGLMDELFLASGAPMDVPYDWNLDLQDDASADMPIDSVGDGDRDGRVRLSRSRDTKRVGDIAGAAEAATGNRTQGMHMDEGSAGVCGGFGGGGGGGSPDQASIAQMTNNSMHASTGAIFGGGDGGDTPAMLSSDALGAYGCAGIATGRSGNDNMLDAADVHHPHRSAAPIKPPCALSSDHPTAPVAAAIATNGRNTTASVKIAYKVDEMMDTPHLETPATYPRAPDASMVCATAHHHHMGVAPTICTQDTTPVDNIGSTSATPRPAPIMSALANIVGFGTSFTGSHSMSMMTPSAASFYVSKTTSTYGPMVVMNTTSSSVSSVVAGAMAPVTAAAGSATGGCGGVGVNNGVSATGSLTNLPLTTSQGEHPPTFMSTMIRSLSLSRADTGAGSSSSSSGVGFVTASATPVMPGFGSTPCDDKDGKGSTDSMHDVQATCDPHPPPSHPPQNTMVAQHIRSRRFRFVH